MYDCTMPYIKLQKKKFHSSDQFSITILNIFPLLILLHQNKNKLNSLYYHIGIFGCLLSYLGVNTQYVFCCLSTVIILPYKQVFINHMLPMFLFFIRPRFKYKLFKSCFVVFTSKRLYTRTYDVLCNQYTCTR